MGKGEFYGALADLVMGERDCREGWPNLRGDQPLVVEADDGYVVRDPSPGLFEIWS